MRNLCLLFFGVIVGWAASGVDWSREAVGEPVELPSNPPTATIHSSPSPIAAAPQPASPNGRWPRRVFETHVDVDANGQHRPVTVSRLVNADGTIVPETPPGLIGRFQASAYGSPSGHGCYIVDTMTGKTWHITPGVGRQVVSETLIQTVAPTPAHGPWLTPDHQPPAGMAIAPTPSYSEPSRSLQSAPVPQEKSVVEPAPAPTPEPSATN